MTPTVSIVLSTYNRSRVLRYAIQSVLDSTFTAWELIIVGDCCTDDTEARVGEFTDPRIRFVNLAENCGEQSGPNNHGVTLARGRYLAYLNHDDMYLPDHLERMVGELEQGSADLVWSPCVLAASTPETGSSPAPTAFCLGAGPGPNGYTPFHDYPASTWVFRRELVDRIGPWRRAADTFVTPGQAWLFKAYCSGAKLRFLPRIGVICVSAGTRRNAYRLGEEEHQRIYSWMRSDPRFREHLCEAAAVGTLKNDVAHGVHHAPWTHFARAFLRPAYALLRTFGVHPRSLNQALLYRRRGGMIRAHREFTGAAAPSARNLKMLKR